MSKIKTKTVLTKGCKGNGGKKMSIFFPSGVNKAFIKKCLNVGFCDNEKYTNAGILFIQKGPITISGSLCLKHATLFCSQQDCDKVIEETITLLDSLF